MIGGVDTGDAGVAAAGGRRRGGARARLHRRSPASRSARCERTRSGLAVDLGFAAPSRERDERGRFSPAGDERADPASCGAGRVSTESDLGFAGQPIDDSPSDRLMGQRESPAGPDERGAGQRRLAAAATSSRVSGDRTSSACCMSSSATRPRRRRFRGSDGRRTTVTVIHAPLRPIVDRGEARCSRRRRLTAGRRLGAFVKAGGSSNDADSMRFSRPAIRAQAGYAAPRDAGRAARQVIFGSGRGSGACRPRPPASVGVTALIRAGVRAGRERRQCSPRARPSIEELSVTEARSVRLERRRRSSGPVKRCSL